MIDIVSLVQQLEETVFELGQPKYNWWFVRRFNRVPFRSRLKEACDLDRLACEILEYSALSTEEWKSLLKAWNDLDAILIGRYGRMIQGL